MQHHILPGTLYIFTEDGCEEAKAHEKMFVTLTKEKRELTLPLLPHQRWYFLTKTQQSSYFVELSQKWWSNIQCSEDFLDCGKVCNTVYTIRFTVYGNNILFLCNYSYIVSIKKIHTHSLVDYNHQAFKQILSFSNAWTFYRAIPLLLYEDDVTVGLKTKGQELECIEKLENLKWKRLVHLFS